MPSLGDRTSDGFAEEQSSGEAALGPALGPLYLSKGPLHTAPLAAPHFQAPRPQAGWLRAPCAGRLVPTCPLAWLPRRASGVIRGEWQEVRPRLARLWLLSPAPGQVWGLDWTQPLELGSLGRAMGRA